MTSVTTVSGPDADPNSNCELNGEPGLRSPEPLRLGGDLPNGSTPWWSVGTGLGNGCGLENGRKLHPPARLVPISRSTIGRVFELASDADGLTRLFRRSLSKVDRRCGEVARISAGSDTVAERFLGELTCGFASIGEGLSMGGCTACSSPSCSISISCCLVWLLLWSPGPDRSRRAGKFK